MQRLALKSQNVTNGLAHGCTPRSSMQLRRKKLNSGREIVVSLDTVEASSEAYEISKRAGHKAESGCLMKRIYSDSMSPVVPVNSTVFLKEINWQSIVEYGRIHYIVAIDGRAYLRYLKRSTEDSIGSFLLVAANSNYDAFDIPKSRIQSIWAFRGHLTLLD